MQALEARACKLEQQLGVSKEDLSWTAQELKIVQAEIAQIS